MPQFTVEKELVKGQTISIDGNDAHHITNVLRLKKGDWIVLCDGQGGRVRAQIEYAQTKEVHALITEELPRINTGNLTLAQAVIKHDSIEAIIQKAVELGVKDIIPFSSERTIPKFNNAVACKKLERWNKIAVEASKQCGLAVKPTVEPIRTFQSLVENSSMFDAKILFYEGENTATLAETTLNQKAGVETILYNPKTLIVIGPEGGFGRDEVTLAKEHGFATLKLGPLILRVETAAIAATTLTQYLLGHFS